jgi:hypothetical protein
MRKAGEGAGTLLISLKLVLNIFLKLSKEGFDPCHLSIYLSKRGLWRVADPHLLRKQPFQLGLLPLEGVEDIDCCLGQALAPDALLVHSRDRRSAQYKVAAKMANAVTTATNHMRSRGMCCSSIILSEQQSRQFAAGP